jgi:hypothetical protein
MGRKMKDNEATDNTPREYIQTTLTSASVIVSNDQNMDESLI